MTIFGQIHQVNAEIAEMRSMSAHGDYDDLSQYLSCQDPRSVKKCLLYTVNILCRLISNKG